MSGANAQRSGALRLSYSLDEKPLKGSHFTKASQSAVTTRRKWPKTAIKNPKQVGQELLGVLNVSGELFVVPARYLIAIIITDRRVCSLING